MWAEHETCISGQVAQLLNFLKSIRRNVYISNNKCMNTPLRDGRLQNDLISSILSVRSVLGGCNTFSWMLGWNETTFFKSLHRKILQRCYYKSKAANCRKLFAQPSKFVLRDYAHRSLIQDTLRSLNYPFFQKVIKGYARTHEVCTKTFALDRAVCFDGSLSARQNFDWGSKI